MANTTERWYFTKEQIRNSPSVKDGIEHAKELGYRQQCANLIQDIGQRLQVNQLVINTAIVYMHRFYMFHSFNNFHRNTMAPCFVFLAAKVEELPRKLEHVLKASYLCLHTKEDPPLDVKSDEYFKMSQELVYNESILLQTLGFEVSVDHPNTYVVKCAQLVKASKELAQTAYFLATNSLHLTTFCIQHKPTVVACVCIYVACLWANYNIPETGGRNWYQYIEHTANKKQLEELSSYFIKILDSCPTRLKKRLTSGGAVVYKEGKVMSKKDAEDKDESTVTSITKTGQITSDIISKSSIPPKSHLTGLLKPQPHEATPPPSRPSSSCSNHSSNGAHTSTTNINGLKQRHHDAGASRSRMPSDSKKVEIKREEKSQSKMTSEQRLAHAHQKSIEQVKIEQRKKWTPEQLEEYKRRKEKEKMMYKKMLSAENGSSHEHKKKSHSNSSSQKLNNTFHRPGTVRKSSTLTPGDVSSKKLKLSTEARLNDSHLNTSSSLDRGLGMIKKSSHSRPKHPNNHTPSNAHKVKHEDLSPPPPPPKFPSSNLNSTQELSPIKTPPPPPPNLPKYIT